MLSKTAIFVCSGIDRDNHLVNETIEAENKDIAENLFKETFSLNQFNIEGPFYYKKEKINIKEHKVKFLNETRKAIYGGWIVNAFILKEPADHAYLVFIKREDNNKQQSPKSNIIPISNLRFINV
jgi:hypothetical protein